MVDPLGVDAAWAAGACADLVSAGSIGVSIVGRVAFGRRVQELIDALDAGNRSAFSRRCAVANATPKNWVRTGVMRFDHLVRVCSRAGCAPLELLAA